MTRKAHGIIVLAVVVATLSGLAMADSTGAEIYRSKCFKCHGATGMADTPMGKALHVKPINDPSVKTMSANEMVAATRNGMGKMQPYKGSLSEAEIRSATDYFRAFAK